MLSEQLLYRYADVLLWGLKTARTGRLYKGNIMDIAFHVPATPLAEVVYTRLVQMGMHPMIRMALTPRMEKSFYEHANNRQLVFRTPGDEERVRHLNGYISLYGPQAITHLSDIDPKRIGKTTVARKYLRDIMDRRDEEGRFSWTVCVYPTEVLAEHAGLSMAEYTNQIIRACFLDDADPVARWRGIYKQISQIKNRLYSLPVKAFHIESENLDLVVTPGDRRKWLGLSGHNIPSFEVFISPDWRGTRGKYHADQPSYRTGNYVKGVSLEFEKGKVVKAEAETGEEFLKLQLAMDRGACRVGEFSLTDRRFSKIDKFMANTLYDENFGGMHGNCHIALGSAYSDSYDGPPGELTKALKTKLGFNDSALHWDLVNTEDKRVTAILKTGEKTTIYENGMFIY